MWTHGARPRCDASAVGRLKTFDELFAETCAGIGAAERPCPRCDGSREIRLTQFFPDPRPFRIGRVWVSRRLRLTDEVGHVAASICSSCGLVRLFMPDLGEVPWDKIEAFEPIAP